MSIDYIPANARSKAINFNHHSVGRSGNSPITNGVFHAVYADGPGQAFG